LSLPVPLRAMTATSLQPRTGAMRPLSAAGDGSGESKCWCVRVGWGSLFCPTLRRYAPLLYVCLRIVCFVCLCRVATEASFDSFLVFPRHFPRPLHLLSVLQPFSVLVFV
jgi:hypothetical protein